MKEDLDVSITHHLGQQAFLMFLTPRLKYPLYALLPTAALWQWHGWLPERAVPYLPIILWGGVALSAAILIFFLVRTFFEYLGYWYRFSDESFRIQKGYLTRNEMAIAYHHIQQVTVLQSLKGRVVGVADLIITTAGMEHTKSDFVLPAISLAKASLVQHELMRRARRHFMRIHGTSEA